MVKKLKAYLDTSVISYLDQQDAPEKMATTKMFWEWLIKNKKENNIIPVISNAVFEEIDECAEGKREKLNQFLKDLSPEIVEINEDVEGIAQMFIDQRILTQKSMDDCHHIAASIVYNCDFIISWNFKHIVNHKTDKGVKIISAQSGYKPVHIYTPEFFLEGDESDD
jgi:predicted nucleic acid-binding protein